MKCSGQNKSHKHFACNKSHKHFKCVCVCVSEVCAFSGNHVELCEIFVSTRHYISVGFLRDVARKQQVSNTQTDFDRHDI